MRTILLTICFAILIAMASVAYASPCNGVDRQLSDETKKTMAPAIAKQLNAAEVNILQSFRFLRWSIIYVDSHVADEAFLFFADNPLTSHYVTLWSGAASKAEEKKVKTWVLKNAPGIPRRLSSCFAWYVTNNRGK